MYHFIDRPLDRVGNSARFLVWAMRGWARAVEQGTCPPAALSKGFTAMGALRALPDLHMTMALLNRHGLARIAMGPMGCPHIIEDEAVLLSLWREFAQGHGGRAAATLALFAREEGVAPICEAMTAATAKLITAGFDLTTLSSEIIKEENK